MGPKVRLLAWANTTPLHDSMTRYLQHIHVHTGNSDLGYHLGGRDPVIYRCSTISLYLLPKHYGICSFCNQLYMFCFDSKSVPTV